MRPRHSEEGGFHAHACFSSQQAAEKAVKAVHYARGARAVTGHSVRNLIERLDPRIPELDELLDDARELDLNYIPNAVPQRSGGLDSVGRLRGATSGESDRGRIGDCDGGEAAGSGWQLAAQLEPGVESRRWASALPLCAGIRGHADDAPHPTLPNRTSRVRTFDR
ncbi:MAG: HEPN domain-containing protein [Gemmatimonadetes bacterium]|nr:HEPN domain-containing protein [Gemmatimonadota bacterium]MYD14959.1 HEPN domain-containing protein [Gemmatimonadota bacterium]MYI66256.1 HEPN domain-containing protein [Gemmatimonadota bacterium]